MVFSVTAFVLTFLGVLTLFYTMTEDATWLTPRAHSEHDREMYLYRFTAILTVMFQVSGVASVLGMLSALSERGSIHFMFGCIALPLNMIAGGITNDLALRAFMRTAVYTK